MNESFRPPRHIRVTAKQEITHCYYCVLAKNKGRDIVTFTPKTPVKPAAGGAIWRQGLKQR
jgi:hypothetical protein